MATILAHFSTPEANFEDLLTTMCIDEHRASHLINDGFTSMEEFTNHFAGDIDAAFDKYLTQTNHTFSVATARIQFQFLQTNISMFKEGILFYFTVALIQCHTVVVDIDQITPEEDGATAYGNSGPSQSRSLEPQPHACVWGWYCLTVPCHTPKMVPCQSICISALSYQYQTDASTSYRRTTLHD